MSFDFFRRSLYLYWTLLIFYSSVVLISIYCYQFSLFPTYWRRITHLDKQWNHDIGLINYKEEGDSGYLLSDIFSHIWAYLPYISLLMLKFFILYHRNSSIFQCPFYSAVKSNFILLFCKFSILSAFLFLVQSNWKKREKFLIRAKIAKIVVLLTTGTNYRTM